MTDIVFWCGSLKQKLNDLLDYFVGNKAEGRISEQGVQEIEACKIFRKANIPYPLIRVCTCAYQGVANASCTHRL